MSDDVDGQARLRVSRFSILDSLKKLLPGTLFGSGAGQGQVASADRDGLNDVVGDFLDADVRDIMLHRNETRALRVGSTRQEIIDTVKEFCHNSRLVVPVCGNNIDCMEGCVSLCDLITFILSNEEEFDWKGRLGRILFVSPSMQVGALLMRMRKNKIHAAVVLDEYGGTDGVVHFDNILNLLVDTTESVSVSDGLCEVSGRISLDVLSSKLDLDLTVDDMPDDIETLGGLILFMLGHVPVAGEVVYHKSGLRFTVKEANAKSILRVIIEKVES